jgi:apolipoprotein N-acyltransferase
MFAQDYSTLVNSLDTDKTRSKALLQRTLAQKRKLKEEQLKKEGAAEIEVAKALQVIMIVILPSLSLPLAILERKPLSLHYH